MKKSLLAAAVAAALMSSGVYAAEPMTGYVGVKTGWSHVSGHTGRWIDPIDHKDTHNWDFGLYGGYNIASFLGIELGYDYLGKFSNKGRLPDGSKAGDYFVHGAELSLVPAIPITESSDIFFKVGALYANVKDDVANHTASGPVPLLGAGARLGLGEDFLVRLEYMYAHDIIEDKDWGYSPDLMAVNLGLEYKFGGYTAPVPAPAPEPEPKTEVVSKTVSLSAEALFGFNSAELSQDGKSAIAGETQKVREDGVKDLTIKVEGHTDRIGSEEFNQKLSEKRAEAVVQEFVADGIDPATISAEGFGETRPVTGTECDGVKNKKKLIECLAPDRRVEVKFNGVKEYTETK